MTGYGHLSAHAENRCTLYTSSKSVTLTTPVLLGDKQHDLILFIRSATSLPTEKGNCLIDLVENEIEEDELSSSKKNLENYSGFNSIFFGRMPGYFLTSNRKVSTSYHHNSYTLSYRYLMLGVLRI